MLHGDPLVDASDHTEYGAGWKDDYGVAWEAFSHLLFAQKHQQGVALFAQGVKPDPRYVVRLWKAQNLAVRWIPGAMKAIMTIKQNYPDNVLLLVTNTTEPGWVTVMWNLNPEILSVFSLQHTILSCLLPVAKPDPWIWKLIQEKYPDDIEYWMIGDDPLIDIAVPAAMGWKTILVGQKGVSIVDVPQILVKGVSR